MDYILSITSYSILKFEAYSHLFLVSLSSSEVDIRKEVPASKSSISAVMTEMEMETYQIDKN